MEENWSGEWGPLHAEVDTQADKEAEKEADQEADKEDDEEEVSTTCDDAMPNVPWRVAAGMRVYDGLAPPSEARLWAGCRVGANWQGRFIWAFPGSFFQP